MAWLMKVKTTVYLDSKGNRVPRTTKGARKAVIDSDKWYGCWKENGKSVRIPLAKDKQAAQTMLATLIRQKERGEAGLINPFKEHLEKAVGDHVIDYLAVVQSTTRSERHQKETERILNLFVRNSGVKQLKDLTADLVSRYLSKLKSGPTTRNMHRRIICTFCNWLEGVNRIDRNPITTKNVKPAKNGKKRTRRSLKPEEITALLEAVKDYPLRSASINRGGRNAKKKPAENPASLSPEYQEELRQRGRERALLYRIAILTGLRRGEISRLLVQHIDFESKPFPKIKLPGHLTKNGKEAKILLVPSLAADLKQWIADKKKKYSNVVIDVPDASNLSRMHKAHLEGAGIPYEVDGAFADFHSLRMSANVVLRKAGIPPKERQLFMRHSKLELTTETYDDETATEMEEIVRSLEKLNL